MIGTPIAFGLTMIVCFTLFYYYWRIRQLRARLLSVQAAPVLDDLPMEFGIGKNVVETFPTIKACELKCTASEDLQCPICLVEYEEWEVLRQLPFCGHIFHTLCVGAWFEKQTTCPVCRMSMSEMTEPFGSVAEDGSRCRGPASAEGTAEVGPGTPSWMVVNRRLPLPAPPAPTTATERAPPDSSPRAGPNGNGDLELKTANDSARICERPQPDGRHEDANFHVVNIPPEEWRPTCQKCRRPTNSFSSEDSFGARPGIPEPQEPNAPREAREPQGSPMADGKEARIPIPTELNVYKTAGEREEANAEILNPRGRFRTQETSGSRDPVAADRATSAEVDGAASNSCGVDSKPGPAKNERDADTTSESQHGSFEFQSVISSSGGWTIEATTASDASASAPLPSSLH